MARNVWPRFDHTAEFVAAKPFKADGHNFTVDEPFDKKLVTTRRLRQMYDLKQVKMIAGLTVEKRPADKPVVVLGSTPGMDANLEQAPSKPRARRRYNKETAPAA